MPVFSVAPQVGGDGGKRAVPPPAALLDFARSNFLPLGELPEFVLAVYVGNAMLVCFSNKIK